MVAAAMALLASAGAVAQTSDRHQAGLKAGLEADKPAANAPPKKSASTTTRQQPAQAPHRGKARAKKAPSSPRLGAPPPVREFAAGVAQRRALPKDWVLAQLRQARRVQAVRSLIMPAPAGVAKNWQAYRERFTTAERIAAGAAFWQANAGWLEQAEHRYGVPAHIVVGIVGVETFYGRIMGNFRVLDALATLAFDFPEGRSDRSAFFKDELEEFLVLSHREKVSPLAVKGSYAGAMGLPQFMPSSTNKYAVDFDGDGHIQLHDKPADVVGSVANYLVAHGWQRQMPIYFDVQAPADPDRRSVLLAPDITPSFSAIQMTEQGAVLATDAQGFAGPLALVELQNGDASPSHVAGTQNFYVLTRYNRSSYYAMAVIELGEAVARARR